MRRRVVGIWSTGVAAPLSRLLLSSMLCGIVFDAAAATPSQLLPLVDPPSAEHHVGKFIFVELVTSDLPAAETFYGSLFGWTFSDVQASSVHYAEASLDHHPVAGLVYRPLRAEKRQPAWLSFVAVTDVDAVDKTAVAHGGRTLSAPHDVSGLGRVAVLADPQGAVFAILASGSGDPPEEMASTGEWIWASLYTSDPDGAAAFYQTLFDYEVFDAPEAGSDQHFILASGDYARAAANPLPAVQAHPHWLNFVRVDDATRTAARVVALGGNVLLTPRDDRHGGKIAIVADPQGAPFGLLEWPDDRSTKVSP